MSWMGRTYVDAMELQEFMSTRLDMDPGDLGYEIEEKQGWIGPTGAGLARTLITEVMGRTPHNEEDTKQLERVIGLLGTGV